MNTVLKYLSVGMFVMSLVIFSLVRQEGGASVPELLLIGAVAICVSILLLWGVLERRRHKRFREGRSWVEGYLWAGKAMASGEHTSEEILDRVHGSSHPFDLGAGEAVRWLMYLAGDKV